MTEQPLSYNVTEAHITRTPGVCGGAPCIAGRRIRVQHIYIWHEVVGMTADEIARSHNLMLSQVYAALTYAFENIDEIQAEIREEEKLITSSMQRHPSKLKTKFQDE